jgi:hypothetical protein
VDEAVALADLECLSVLPGDPEAAEHEENLLLRTLRVGRSRPLAWVDEDALEPHVDAPRRTPEVVPVTGQMALLAPARLDVVPVRDVSHG